MDQSSSSAGATAQSDRSLLGQAQQWLHQGSLGDMLGRIPSVKNIGNQTVSSFNKLSTTQKVVGGTLLALGVGYLVRRNSDGKANAQTSTSDQSTTLHELLQFVNDRIEGYEHAVAESQDAELRGYYKQLVSQSQQFANQLNSYLRQEDGSEETGTTIKGTLYHGWMDVKATLTGADEKAILGSNIYGEEWALKAYKDALDDRTLTGAVRQAVERQYALSKSTYKKLQKLKAKQ